MPASASMPCCSARPTRWSRQGQEAQTDLIILTHDTREGTMNDALARMQVLPSVLQPITRIRKEELA
jgi:hypothetical protein